MSFFVNVKTMLFKSSSVYLTTSVYETKSIKVIARGSIYTWDFFTDLLVIATLSTHHIALYVYTYLYPETTFFVQHSIFEYTPKAPIIIMKIVK